MHLRLVRRDFWLVAPQFSTFNSIICLFAWYPVFAFAIILRGHATVDHVLGPRRAPPRLDCEAAEAGKSHFGDERVTIAHDTIVGA